MTQNAHHDGPGLAIGAELFVDLGNKVDRIHDRMGSFAKPVYKPVGTSFVVPSVAPASVIIDIPISPARGRVWNVLKVIFGSVTAAGPDIHTILANVVADVYSGDSPDLGGGAVVNAIIGGAAIASVTNITKHVDWCASGEHLFAIVYGAAANAQLIMAARVAEYPVEAVEALSVLWI